MNDFRKRYVNWLVRVGIFHTLLILAAGILVYESNKTQLTMMVVPTGALWVNVSLFGFVGSLLYFSRKVYVYLITDKIGRVLESFNVSEADGRVQAAMIGYLWYLVWRPFVGLVVGPLVTFIVLGGLNTIAKSETAGALALSEAGICVIYVLSFVGGYTSSDLLDYLAKTGGRLLVSSKQD